MAEEERKIIKINDGNYAIYRIGQWKNNYEINQIGLSDEVPVSQNTVKHVKHVMDEIRSSSFEIDNLTVNGFVAIAIQLNPKIQEMELADVCELEEKEFELINEELDNLDLLDEDETMELENWDYLVYKLQTDCHVTQSTPANGFAFKHYVEEMQKIEDSLSDENTKEDN